MFSIKPESYKTKSVSCEHYIQKTNTARAVHHGNPDNHYRESEDSTTVTRTINQSIDQSLFTEGDT